MERSLRARATRARYASNALGRQSGAAISLSASARRGSDSDLGPRGKDVIDLRADFPFRSTIVLEKKKPFPWVFANVLERRIPGKNGEGSTRIELRGFVSK